MSKLLNNLKPKAQLAVRRDGCMFANILYVDDVQADILFSQFMKEMSALGVELNPKHKGMLFSKTGLSLCG